jgi:hypothetical protein
MNLMIDTGAIEIQGNVVANEYENNTVYNALNAMMLIMISK